MSIITESLLKLKAKGNMETIWQNVLDSEELKEMLSIKYISYDWIGNPGWFIWLEDTTGVYHFEIKDYYTTDLQYSCVNMIVRYYPDLEEKCFSTFSLGERVVRKSELFKNSNISTIKSDGEDYEWIEVDELKTYGIPVPQGRKLIHPSLFIIGEMNFIFNERDLMKIDIISQNIYRTINQDGVVMEGKTGYNQLLYPGEIDRKVEGLKLITKFASKIAMVHIFIDKKYPEINIDILDGDELLEISTKEIEIMKNKELKKYIINLDFEKAKSCFSKVDILEFEHDINNRIKGD